jgi:polyhydroxyalkanoate synthase subunit PhaC
VPQHGPGRRPILTAPRGDESASASFDRALAAWRSRLTSGMSPMAASLAAFDWFGRLAGMPGRQAYLAAQAWRNSIRLAAYALRLDRDAPCEPSPEDRRFADPEWERWPFNVISQAFLLNEQWWQEATTGVPGVSPHHEQIASFGARQLLDMFSPSNFFWTNPRVLRKTLDQRGKNLGRGGRLLFDDWRRLLSGTPAAGTEAFTPGESVAVTPGRVVYRNRLIELIQYEPTTDTVHAEPVLIISAWIMKYYILDLSPDNSLVKYLVDRGHTVFIISWRNPTSGDRDLGMEDYLQLGAMEALDAVTTIVPERRVHAVGYCIGGTLLSIAAAAMARDGDERLQSVTLFAAETDFTEPGELGLFVDEGQVADLENVTWDQGYLDAKRMAGTFQMLRPYEQLWSRVVGEYLLGERELPNDLMAWNADGTRLPYRMHSEYLHSLFLQNDLFEGRYLAGGRPVSLPDIRVPMFIVATTRDHVAPWRSVYKLNLVAKAELTFALTAGGHNAGIVSEPGHPRRNFQLATRPAGAAYVDPDRWLEQTSHQEGSWWPAWEAWLAERSSGRHAPPAPGAPASGYPPLADAPGTYILQR